MHFHGPMIRSQMRGGRSSAAIPDVEVLLEIETRQEPEMNNPAEIEVSVSTICEGDLGATGKPSEIAETVSNTYRVIYQHFILASG